MPLITIDLAQHGPTGADPVNQLRLRFAPVLIGESRSFTPDPSWRMRVISSRTLRCSTTSPPRSWKEWTHGATTLRSKLATR